MIIDAETQAKLDELEWTPKQDWVIDRGSGRKGSLGSHLLCDKGVLYYVNATAEYVAGPFDG